MIKGEYMFDKCIPCKRLGESCVPNIMLLSFPELIHWCDKRQKHLGWTNQTLAEHSTVALGTINRIKAGDYLDAKYSTIKNILIALIGGTKDEFSCTEQVANELSQMEALEHQASKLEVIECENEALKNRIAEYQEEVAFLRDEVRVWQSVVTKKDLQMQENTNE